MTKVLTCYGGCQYTLWHMKIRLWPPSYLVIYFIFSFYLSFIRLFLKKRNENSVVEKWILHFLDWNLFQEWCKSSEAFRTYHKQIYCVMSGLWSQMFLMSDITGIISFVMIFTPHVKHSLPTSALVYKPLNIQGNEVV